MIDKFKIKLALIIFVAFIFWFSIQAGEIGTNEFTVLFIGFIVFYLLPVLIMDKWKRMKEENKYLKSELLAKNSKNYRLKKKRKKKR